MSNQRSRLSFVAISIIPMSMAAHMCTQDEIPEVPGDFSIRYEWSEGSLPPPGHYEYTIQLGPGLNGRLLFLPDYKMKDTPTWEERFDISEKDLAQLYDLVDEKSLLEKRWQTEQLPPPVGGSREYAEISAKGLTQSIPAHLTGEEKADVTHLYSAIRSLVPESTWIKVREKHERFKQNYRRKKQ